MKCSVDSHCVLRERSASCFGGLVARDKPGRLSRTQACVWSGLLLLSAALAAGAARAPGGLDASFDPGTSIRGGVQALAVLADGKVLVAGTFTSVYGVPRNRLARLEADGTLDRTYQEGLDGISATVQALVLQPDGKAVIGGFFSTVNGVSRARIARLNADGTLDAGFQDGMGGADGAVWALALQSDGQVIVGGDFTMVNGQPCNRIARLHPDGSLDTNFVARGSGADGVVRAVAVQADGRILLAGDFASVHGEERQRIARLHPGGSLDQSFLEGLKGADNTVQALALQPDGRVLVGGGFSKMNNVRRDRLARLEADGSLDVAFTNRIPGIQSDILSITVLTNGQIIVGGRFTSSAGPPLDHLVRLRADGAPDTSFMGGLTGVDGPVNAVWLAADGRLMLGGEFAAVNGEPRSRVARLAADGSLDNALQTGTNGPNGVVWDMALQPDGRVLIGGLFAAVNGVPRNRVARLDARGRLDPDFLAGRTGANSVVWALDVSASGRVVLGGEFTNVNGLPRTRIARLQPDGQLDTAFQEGMAGANGPVRSVLIQEDGRTLLAGDFTTVNGQPRGGLARLNPHGSLDVTFLNGLAGAGDGVWAITLQPDGKVLVGGDFTTFNGVARNRLARLHSDGSLDASFLDGLEGADNFVRSLAIQSDGKVLVGGRFNAFNGRNHARLVRLHSDGRLDETFTPNIGGSGNMVLALAVQSDGGVLIGGDFTTVDGVSRSRIARLQADGRLDMAFLGGLTGADAGQVASVLVQPDGQVLLAGSFGNVNGVGRDYVARLDGSVTNDAPVIVGEPTDQRVPFEGAARFAVPATGQWPLTYQWFFNETNRLAEATNASLWLPDAIPAQAGTYSVTISNAVGVVRSRPAALHVQSFGAPAVWVQGRFGPGRNFFFTNLPAAQVWMETAFTGGEIHFTLDGSTPSFASPLYTGPFTVSEPGVLRAVAYSADFLQSAAAEPVELNFHIDYFFAVTITNTAGGQVAIDPPTGPYLSNTVVTLTAMPEPGWGLVAWTNAAGGTNTNIELTVDRDLAVGAIFGAPLNVSPIGGGQVFRSPDAVLYPPGSVVRLTAIPQADRYFFRWNPASLGMVSPMQFTTSGPTNLTGLFAPLPAGQHSLAVQIVGEGHVTIDPPQNGFTEGQTVNLTAAPGSGSVFVGWSGDAQGTNNPLPLVMDANKAVAASFSIPPQIALLSPQDGMLFLRPVDIPLQVSVRDLDGTVAQVEFYVDGDLLGVATEAPFELTWSNAPSGSFAITARAYDDLGVRTDTVPARIEIVKPVPSIGEFHPASGFTSSSVTILGTNFHPIPASNIVFFGATRALVSSASPTSLTVSVPAGATYAPITVTTEGGKAESAHYFLPSFEGDGGFDENSFAANLLLPNSGVGGYLEISDLDNDARPDLVVNSYAGELLSLFPNLATPGSLTTNSFGPRVDLWHSTGPGAVSDLNRDGRPDLVVPWGMFRPFIAQNQGVGGTLGSNSFPATVTLDPGITAEFAAVRDLNRDGMPDVIFSRWNTETVSILQNTNTGELISAASFRRPLLLSSGTPGGAIAVAPEDLDGDGCPDLIIVNNDDVLSVRRNTPSAGDLSESSFEEPVTFSAGPEAFRLAVGDIDGDGRLDVAVGNYDTAEISVFRNTSTSGAIDTNSLAPRVTFPVGNNPQRIAFGDLNGDGRLDMAVANEASLTVSVLINTGSPGVINSSTFAPHIEFPTGGTAIGPVICDVDGDGVADLVVANYSMTVSVYRNRLGIRHQRPSVVLTNPVMNSVFAAPAAVSLAAEASDPDGVVTQVAFFAQDNLLGIRTNAPFALTWVNVGIGDYTLTAVATDNDGLSATSPPVSLSVTGVLAAPLFSLSSPEYQVDETMPTVTVTVLKTANSAAGSVTIQTRDGRATALEGGSGDYVALSNVLDFAAGQTAQPVNITLVNDNLSEGNHAFEVFLSHPTAGGALLAPTNATVTIIDDDAPPLTESVTNRPIPGPLPPSDNALRIMLDPIEAVAAGAQWRFAWDLAWRDSGALLTVVAGNYPIEFKPVAGFVQPSDTVLPVSGGSQQVQEETYEYSIVPSATGALRINLLPNNAGLLGLARWSLQGAGQWQTNGAVIEGLAAGAHIVEFNPVAGWVTPRPVAVRVFAHQINARDVVYLVEETVADADEPTRLLFDNILLSTNTGLPYAYCGQLQTEAGFSSGFVVKPRVVLTAAHALFNEATLSYVTEARWFFQKHRGSYEPPAQTPRGWYVFEGYKSQRTNDPPGESSLASRNLDAAALYFVEGPAGPNLPGRGGAGGFLVSDTVPNPWLTNGALKTLVGYPVEEISEADRGKMHATQAGPWAFRQVFGQVYGTADLRGYPGNSGGPLCVEHPNGVYYPAAIYLGGAGESLVRAIDSTVVDLINRAEISGNAGGNNTGGGVVAIDTRTAGSQCGGTLRVVIEPAAAREAGARWWLESANASDQLLTNRLYASDQFPLALAPGEIRLFFTDVPGFITPVAGTNGIACEQHHIVTARYVPMMRLTLSSPTELRVAAVSGSRLALEWSTNLTSWFPWPAGPFELTDTNLQITLPTTNLPTRFFRARVE